MQKTNSEYDMKQTASHHPRRNQNGFSAFELLIVVTLIAIVGAITVPQMIAQRRLLLSAGVPREIVSQIRLARQQAMTQRQAFTLQYDNNTKQIAIIDHNASGTSILADPGYPNNAGSTVVSSLKLAGGGSESSEITYGIPSGLPTGPLSDGVAKTNLNNARLNITFQPDGSVVDVNGNPVNRGLFIYNSKAPRQTAVAVSILGAAGRIKFWRYESSANQFVE